MVSTGKSKFKRPCDAKGEFAMDEKTLIWKCLQCGYVSNCTDERCHVLPDKCPDCGAPKTEMEVIEED